jgi:hypothetical protein
MESCTITKNLEIVPSTRADYESLSQYHYRETRVGPYASIYVLKGKFRTAERLETVGVIVYAMPTAGCSMRSAAMPFLTGLDRRTRMAILNKNVRAISRVIIEPRFRSLGLAARLVSQTMPLMNVPFVEALAVMGQVNPFFEKAGMMRYDSPPSPACARLLEAFGAVGINEQDLIDPELFQQKLDSLLDTRRHCERSEAISKCSKDRDCRGPSNDDGPRNDKSEFIELEITRFLQSYGRRRLMKPGIERTQFILSKLTDRPVYYLWKNSDIELRI